MIQAKHHSYSKHNLLAQPTKPLNIEGEILARIAGLSYQSQWILFTSECPRPDYEQLSSFNVMCQNVIHMKASRTKTEIEIVMQAILSGNASAIVASNNIDIVNQKLLCQMASRHGCEIFFVEGRNTQYH
ncbi:hypothetical protein SAMN04488136_105168 [Vibrio xiamenensis]|uniref:Superfamily II DNA and RNA helicase n=1 Tax=Vibrio xiamenensis TaxID=861298 RepID=A0A1G7YJV2_9VIBR|nr:hypothetical protein [Vibrio xiamenensis]SDG96565.1 hypothetical protein SAMN04488136_105168 [Vibrio xiamenensis]